MPLINVPVSRKVVATFVVGLTLTGLRKVGVYETSPEVTALIVSGVGLAVGAVIAEGTKYVNYFLKARNLPLHVEDEA
jgi:hypothetical protein